MRSPSPPKAHLAAATIVSFALAACGGSERRPAETPRSTTSTTSARLTVATPAPRQNATVKNDATPTTSSAVVQLSKARCDHAASCASSSKGDDHDTCMNEAGFEAVSLIPETCAPSADAVGACVSALEGSGCDAPKKPLAEIASCASLCPRASTPPAAEASASSDALEPEKR